MINPDNLKFLRELRQTAGLSQADVAAYFGLKGKGGRNNVATWEKGEVKPGLPYREQFKHYLAEKLGLYSQRDLFFRYWDILKQEWDWSGIEIEEWYVLLDSIENSSKKTFGGRFGHTATLLANGQYVLVIGGRTVDELRFDSVIAYNIEKGEWEDIPNLDNRRDSHTATLLKNGELLVVGGHGSGSVLRSVELYNAVDKKWRTISPLKDYHSSHTAVLLDNGCVLVAGGNNPPSNITELYNPTAKIWTRTSNLAHARMWHTATKLKDGKVLVVGGGSPPISKAELYDPHTGTWSPAGDLKVARARHTAILLHDGRVLVAGGENRIPLADAEIYDPETKEWSSISDLNDARMDHTATLLDNGHVLVVGGFNLTYDWKIQCPNVLNSTELYDVDTNTWMVPRNNLLRGRAGHTATALHRPTKQILIVGGHRVVFDTRGLRWREIATAEVYDGTTGEWKLA